MKILNLILKHKWYNAIKDNGKREEYRQITPYWERRLTKAHWAVIPYDAICFHKGYTKTCMTFRYDGLEVGQGKQELGAPADKDVFILHFSDRLD